MDISNDLLIRIFSQYPNARYRCKSTGETYDISHIDYQKYRIHLLDWVHVIAENISPREFLLTDVFIILKDLDKFDDSAAQKIAEAYGVELKERFIVSSELIILPIDDRYLIINYRNGYIHMEKHQMLYNFNVLTCYQKLFELNFHLPYQGIDLFQKNIALPF